MKIPLSLAALVAGSLLIAVPGSSAAQTYYKWVDDAGTVHFTAEPPADRDYESIDTHGNVVATTRSAGTEPEGGESTPSEAEATMPREGEPDPAAVRERCAQARENLFWLETKRRIVVEDDQGNERFIDAEEQQDLIEENRALIEEWCEGVDTASGG